MTQDRPPKSGVPTKNLAPNRRSTTERAYGRVRLERGDDALDGGIRSQDRTAGRAQHVENVEGLDVPLSSKPALEPSEAGIETRDPSRGRVEALAGLHGVLPDFETEHEEGREGVGELQDAGGGDEGGQVGELGDGGGDDEGDDPVDGHDADPEEFAALLGQGGEVEDVGEEVVVQDFDADIPVQRGRDQGGDEGDDVAGCLPVVRRQALVDRVDGELALVGVDEEAEHEVEEEDEGLGAYHALPEVPGALHFRHEFAEEHRTAVGVYGLHQSHHLTLEFHSGWWTAGRDDRAFVNLVAGFGRVPVRFAVGSDTHGDEDYEQVHPDRRIGDPAEFLERPDLSEDRSGDGEYDATYNEAEAAGGDLRQTLCV